MQPDPEACACPLCGAPAQSITIETSHGTTRVIGCACVPKEGVPQLVDEGSPTSSLTPSDLT